MIIKLIRNAFQTKHPIGQKNVFRTTENKVIEVTEKLNLSGLTAEGYHVGADHCDLWAMRSMAPQLVGGGTHE